MKRELRGLYIDLDAEVFSWKTTDLPSTAADDAVVITTGVLAGTGSPVFDCLSIKEGGGPSSYCSGRIAAALRYAGADAVVIRGQLAKSRVLVLEDGTGMLDDMPVKVENNEALKEGTALRRALRDQYLTDETVIEDRAVPSALLAKGIAAIIVTGTGGLAVADPAAMIDAYIEFYQNSLCPDDVCTCDPLADEACAAILRKLITACYGETCTDEDLAHFQERGLLVAQPAGCCSDADSCCCGKEAE